MAETTAEQETPAPTTRYEIVFEASGTVGVGTALSDEGES